RSLCRPASVRCFLLLRPPPSSPLFPYTTLFRSLVALGDHAADLIRVFRAEGWCVLGDRGVRPANLSLAFGRAPVLRGVRGDRPCRRSRARGFRCGGFRGGGLLGGLLLCGHGCAPFTPLLKLRKAAVDISVTTSGPRAVWFV